MGRKVYPLRDCFEEGLRVKRKVRGMSMMKKDVREEEELLAYIDCFVEGLRLIM